MEHGAHSALQHDTLDVTSLGVVALLVIVTIAVAYSLAARALPRSWPLARTLAFESGCALLALGLSPWMMQQGLNDFRPHMLQHLGIGMLAPLGLVLGAPVSLLLRALPQPRARRVLALLHGSWIHCVAHPVSALALNVGGMYLLYLSPLYAAIHQSLLLYAFVHLHFVLAGCLFCWSMLNGPDLVPRSHTPALRLAVLFAAIAAHALLGKLMFAHGLPLQPMHALDEIRAGAQLMYYGGDFAELLLLIAFFARWRRAPKGARLFRDGPATLAEP